MPFAAGYSIRIENVGETLHSDFLVDCLVEDKQYCVVTGYCAEDACNVSRVDMIRYAACIAWLGAYDGDVPRHL